MLNRAATLLRKARRRLWMKYALRGVGGSDNFERLDLAYSVEDPWNMASDLERARFEATNRVVERAFGHVDSVLELGCGEGHQTEWFARLSDRQYGVDVSAQAVERARRRLPAAKFEATDIFGQPWGDARHRFDLVTACEVLYYLSEPEKTIARMRHLGRNGLVTFFAPACGRVGPHLETIPGLQRDWIFHGNTAWLVAWWRDEA
ncbi:MAG: class I SAM-dependent methyltransferase [Lysobacter sp.]|nr:class I SAM-dependent methyltransferase [Lysobacter sp.]